MGKARVVLVAGVGLWAFAAGVATAQDKHEYGGQFLTNKQGELCTMCEADVTCTEGTPATAPAATDTAGDATPAIKTTIHFQKRGFFGQMSTVLDYFPLTRKYGLYHSRDVDIKTGDAAPLRTTAKLDLEAKRIDILDAAGKTTSWIDRNDGTWRNADGSQRGTCIAPKI